MNVQPIGFNIAEIKTINLKQFRTSNIINKDLKVILLATSTIGGISLLILLCIKIYNVYKHHIAENQMLNFDTQNDDIKIKTLLKAIEKSGSLAWQYRFELARIYLMQNKYDEAKKELDIAYKEKGRPHQNGWSDVKGTDIVSFQNAGSSYIDYQNVLKINYHSGEEALLFAVANAANKNYVNAYDAYNEVMYYNSSISKSRKHQSDIINQIKYENITGNRIVKILEDEKAHSDRLQKVGLH